MTHEIYTVDGLIRGRRLSKLAFNKWLNQQTPEKARELEKALIAAHRRIARANKNLNGVTK